jgi:hypothetical protein
MAITTAMCTTFKKEILEAVHNFKNTGGSTFNLALYTLATPPRVQHLLVLILAMMALLR